MASSLFKQRKHILVEALTAAVTEETDEVTAEYVLELIQDLADEATSNFLSAVDEDYSADDSDLELREDMDLFTDDEY